MNQPRFVSIAMIPLIFGFTLVTAEAASSVSVDPPRLRAASLEFAILPKANTPTSSRTGAKVTKVAGPLKTTVTLLEDGELRLCLVTAHLNSPIAANVSVRFRRALAEDLRLPVSNVLLAVSHNHTDVVLASNQISAYATYSIPASEKVNVPLGPLPPEETLQSEIAEMKDFIRRSLAGDPDTLGCVGLNFPTELSPAYRGKLVEAILPWSQWALELRQNGKAATVPKDLEVEIQVIRLGDVGIVCMPFEPFQGIGRQIRSGSPLPLAIPVGYVNLSHGYLTDAPNTGDHEYMSAHYRYTKYRPPFRKPAGDILADKGIEILNRFAKDEDGK